MMPKGMIRAILQEANGESKVSTAPITHGEMELRVGQQVRKHVAGGFQIATLEIVGFTSPEALMVHDRIEIEEASKKQKETPGVLLKNKDGQYTIWSPRDVAGQIRTNEMFQKERDG